MVFALHNAYYAIENVLFVAQMFRDPLKIYTNLQMWACLSVPASGRMNRTNSTHKERKEMLDAISRDSFGVSHKESKGIVYHENSAWCFFLLCQCLENCDLY